jgi:hypothetical protein
MSSRPSTPVRPGVSPDDRIDLRQHLRDWVAQGLITPDQAARIAATESTRTLGTQPAARPGAKPGPVRPGRIGFVVEALGYLGATFAAVAAFLALRALWADPPVWSELTFAGVGAVVLLAAGALLRPGSDPALNRLQGALWALSTGSLAGFAVLLGDHVLDVADDAIVPLAAATASLYACLLWLRRRAAVQHLVLFASLTVTVGSGVAWLGGDVEDWASGAGIWLLAAVWAAIALRGRPAPVPAAELGAAVGLLLGAVLTMETAGGTVLALATVAALMAGGVVLRTVWLLGVAAVGVLLVVPQAAARYLPDSVAAPLAVLAVGVVLIVVAIRLARSPAGRERS